MRFLENRSGIKSFSDITEQKIIAIDRSLIKKGIKEKSRWANYHSYLRSLISDAQKEGLVQSNPYDRVDLSRGNSKDSLLYFLTLDEFEVLKSAVFTDDRLTKARDLFIFQTYTCLSVADLYKFNAGQIKNVGLAKVLEGHRQKTNVRYLAPLLPGAEAILEKYGGTLPTLPYRATPGQTEEQREHNYCATYNRYIEKIMAEIGIDKHVRSHWARHTGATFLYNAGVSLDIIAKVCGHTSAKMTARYAAMDDATIVRHVLSANII